MTSDRDVATLFGGVKGSSDSRFGSAQLLRTQKLSEQIARRIVREIFTQKLPPGTRLPVESELVASFGVGKNTLREALRLLEGWGVVEIRQGRNGGPIVRAPRPDDVREPLTIQLLFASASLQDVFEARRSIEPQIAMLAAQRTSVESVAELRSSIARMRELAVEESVFLGENHRFHELIAASTGNVVMHAFMDTLRSVFEGTAVVVEYTPTRRLAVADAHELIVDAIEANDSQRAMEVMEQHLREAGEYWGKGGVVGPDELTWER